MDIEIEDRLQEIYTNLEIEVNYAEIRKYYVHVIINDKLYKLLFKYDAHYTFDANINSLVQEIDRCILNYFRK